jgi:predicted RNase H-like HicB family nuclease
MALTRSYSLTIEHYPEDGGYLAYFPALRGCQTWGTTYEETVKHAEEALAVYVESLIAHNEPLPEDTGQSGPYALGMIVNLPVAA